MEHYNPNQAASNIWKYAPVDAANYKVNISMQVNYNLDNSKRFQDIRR